MLMLRAARAAQLCIIYRAGLVQVLVHAGAAPSAATTLRCGCNTIDEYSSICGVGRDRMGYSVWLAGYK
ncbi:hypothetical protein HOY82DRAFT_578999 [Tuber indicum]|nr:hypothetical protein HOY82DRAFT_578999 [Tuber indicum]